MLIDDWSLASPIDKLKDKGGNPCWTVDWNWSQPAAETANEEFFLNLILLMRLGLTKNGETLTSIIQITGDTGDVFTIWERKVGICTDFSILLSLPF